MEPSPKSNDYDRALQLAEAGRHDDALSAIQEHLLAQPDDGQALNDAGALLYALGRNDEAADHLKRALDSFETIEGEPLWNLAEVYLSAGKPAEVLGLFDKMEQVEILNADVANRVAQALLDQGDSANAVEAMLRSFDITPAQAVSVSTPSTKEPATS